MNRTTILGLVIAFLTVIWVLTSGPVGSEADKVNVPPQAVNQAQLAATYGSPLLDGQATDDVWSQAEWMPLDQVWIGAPPASDDFEGRYKLAWDENNLYVLAEIKDDKLTDTHPEGLVKYWDDDCLEIFVDEDASGGTHQYNHNAFAYHIALDNKVTDVAPDSSFQYYNNHCTTRRVTTGNVSIWEVAISIYDGNKYMEGGDNTPKLLKAGKRMGFALAYCDNDHSPERENFIGNVVVEGTDKNRGWIDAGIFAKLLLQQ